VALAYAPNGRIAYAVRHVFSRHHFDIERDDLWILSTDGKRKRILNGEKLVRGELQAPFSYLMTALRWSPDSSRLTAELLTSQVVDQDGNTKEGVATLVLDDTGREIKIFSGDSIIPDAIEAAWLSDNATVVYLTEALKPRQLFALNAARTMAGARHALFPGRTFSDVAWQPKESAAIAVERAPTANAESRLVQIDLLKQTVQDIGITGPFGGRLAISPSGSKVAYYRDHEVLEIIDLRAPRNVARVRVGFGVYQWTSDERRILLKRSLEHKSGDLVWFTVPELVAPAPLPKTGAADTYTVPVREAPLTPALHGIAFRDFAISPDGKFLAVIQTGRRNLQIFPLS
jgi:dipeptidyl aminopeptidase/acylaminoacyl peptidase